MQKPKPSPPETPSSPTRSPALIRKCRSVTNPHCEHLFTLSTPEKSCQNHHNQLSFNCLKSYETVSHDLCTSYSQVSAHYAPAPNPFKQGDLTTAALLMNCEQLGNSPPRIPSPDRPREVGTGTRGRASEQKAQDRADHLCKDQERPEDQPENRHKGEHDQPEDHPKRPPAPIQLQNPTPHGFPSGLRLRNLGSRRRTSVDLQNFSFNRIRHGEQNRRSTRQGNSKFCGKLEPADRGALTRQPEFSPG